MIVRAIPDDETSPLGRAFHDMKAAIKQAAVAEASEGTTARQVRRLREVAETAE